MKIAFFTLGCKVNQYESDAIILAFEKRGFEAFSKLCVADFYIVNTVKCRPPNNRVPSDFEKKCCSDYLSAQINIIKPKVIVLCGSTALKSFSDKEYKISDIRGQWIDLFGEIKAMAIFHPSYLLRNHSLEEGSPRDLTKKDLIRIKNFVEKN